MIIRLFFLTTSLFLIQLLHWVFKSRYQWDIWLSDLWIQLAWKNKQTSKQNGVQKGKEVGEAISLTPDTYGSLPSPAYRLCSSIAVIFQAHNSLRSLWPHINMTQNSDNNMVLILKWCFLNTLYLIHENLVASTNLLAVKISFFFFFHCESVKWKAIRSQLGFVKKRNIEVG